MSEENTPETFDPGNSPFTDEQLKTLLGGSPERFSDKPEDDEDEYEEEEEKPTRPPKDPNFVWLTHPSVPEQMTRHPHTVRPGRRIDAVFNLSKPEELAAFNAIQGEASDHVDGLTSVIHSLDKQFHDGQFYALVTYSKLFYQKLQ